MKLQRAAAIGFLALAVTFAASIGVAAPAAAHDSVVSSTPGDGATVAEVDSVSLTFNDTLLNLGGVGNAFAIQVLGPDERYYSHGCVTLSDSTVSVPAVLGAAGRYEVRWQVVSSDGHPTSDTYTFEYEPAAGVVANEGATAAPSCGTTPDSADSSPNAVAEAATSDSSGPSGILVGLSIGVGVLAVVAAAATFVIARMRRTR